MASSSDPILKAAQDAATDYLDQVTKYGDQAISSGQGTLYLVGAQSIDVRNPTAIEPPVTIPLDATDSAWWDKMTSNAQAFTDWMLTGTASPWAKLATFFQSYLTTYFPTTTDGYATATAWLEEAITNGGTGIPAAVEAQIWARARDKLSYAFKAAEAQAWDQAASSGAPMPPGALAAQVQELRMNWLRESSSLATDIAMKQIDIEIQNIRFAVDKSLALRHQAVNSAAHYLGALGAIPRDMSVLGSQLGSRQAQLIEAAGNYYRARLTKDQLIQHAGMGRQHIALQTSAQSLHMAETSLQHSVAAAVGAAEATAKTAQGYFSSLSGIGADITVL